MPIQRVYFARADLAVSLERQRCKVASRPCKNCKSRLAECGGSEKDPTCTIIMHQHYFTASRNLHRYQYIVSDHLCPSHKFTVRQEDITLHSSSSNKILSFPYFRSLNDWSARPRTTCLPGAEHLRIYARHSHRHSRNDEMNIMQLHLVCIHPIDVCSFTKITKNRACFTITNTSLHLPSLRSHGHRSEEIQPEP